MEEKRGQTAIWIILSLFIVVVLMLILFKPDFSILPFIGGEINPEQYLDGCLEPKLKENINLLSKQGGYANPNGTILHEGVDIKYLCYTDKYYQTCVVQQPLIKRHFENELNELLSRRLVECADNLKEQYEKKNYGVFMENVDSKVYIEPGEIRINYNLDMVIEKEEIKQNFEGFDVKIKSEMYDLLLLATSILEFEAQLGDSQTSLYYQYYPNLIIRKNNLGDGTTIYKLEHAITGESFTFASRSLAWPPGYGLE